MSSCKTYHTYSSLFIFVSMCGVDGVLIDVLMYLLSQSNEGKTQISYSPVSTLGDRNRLWLYCMWLSYLLASSVPDECYSSKASYYLRFYYSHWVDTSAGGLLVSEGIARSIVNATALLWFITYFYYQNLQLSIM